ncbi:transcription factor bZIP protein [Colletotrichum tofieldiae]|uniref:Transcription factor bZIP protein n=1 Tax=Colletotrichum tofieldiae TaxID=708197 RepID=A0A166N0E5_9PEZI|nr:transcription factor bZIP protein [Colletotrichum tofieldiae]
MSQRGPAPHTTTQAPTQSPPRAPFSSQQSPQARGSPGSQDVVTTPSAAGERHLFGPRSLGIRGLINEAQSEGSAGESSQPRGADAQTSPYGMPPRQYSAPGDRQYTYQSHGPLGSQPVTPAGHPATTPLGHTPSEHNSPKSGFPFPPMGAPRQILSPRETRAASMSQASMRAPESHQAHFMPPRVKRPYPGDDGPSEPLRTAPGHPFSGPPSHGPPSAGIGSLTTPSRTMSQPMIGHMPTGNPDRHQLPPMTRDPHGRGPEYPGQPMLPPGPSFPPPQSPGVPVWSTPGAGTSLYQSLRSDVTKAEGGMVVRLPGEEGGILIPVDVHQASKQADEKRQRNAGASARFRQRKKERDQEQIANLQKLEQRSRDLEVRLRDMTQERDFYRDERNRLRDVVLRTPLSDMANGPPSPTSSRSGGSMAETSPLTQAPMLPHQSQQHGYASSEASSVERPTRRRRTESAQTPEFSMPSYGTPVPQAGSLPPMQAPAYGMMQQRSPSTAPGGERLPPLRVMEGSYPGSDAGPSVSAGGPLYPSYTRVPHETGFASRTAGPTGHHSHHGHDGGPR